MQRADVRALLMGVGLIALMAVGLRLLLRKQPARTQRLVLATCIATAAGLAGWLIAVRPAFIHAEFYGPDLITAILDGGLSRQNYARLQGILPFHVLHTLALPIERSAEGVVAANAVLASLAVLLLSLLALRWSRSPAASLFTALLAMSSPLIARVAHSEDASPTAAVLSLLVTLAIDIAARDRSLLALCAVGVLGQLVPQVRQTFFAWEPAWLVLWFELRRQAWKKEQVHARWFDVLGALFILAIPVACALSMLARNGKEVGMLALGLKGLVQHWWAIETCLVMHPLFDWRLSVVLMPLAFYGMVVLFRRSEVRWTWLTAFGGAFTLGFCQTWPTPDNLWAFRVPTYLPVLLAAGIGAATLEETWRSRVQRPAAVVGVPLAIGAVIVLAALLGPRAKELRQPDPEFTNYQFVRDSLVAEAQRGPIGVVTLEDPEPRSAARAAAHLLQLPRVSAAQFLTSGAPDASIRWLWFDELACHSFGVLDILVEESTGAEDMIHEMKTREELFTIALFDRHRRFGLDLLREPVPRIRPVCAGMQERSSRAATAGFEIHPPQVPPMVVYAENSTIVPELREARATSGDVSAKKDGE